jgi:hypothetical protein
VTTLDRLRDWNQAGIITDVQYHTLAALVRKERISDLGDAFILGTCSLLFAGCLYYCFSRGAQYSHGAVESPSLAFDYVLYLGCLILSAELAYIEFRFHVFHGAWDHYLLFTAAAFALLAYRFDNRFVLSLALASFAGWFGLKVSAFDFRSADALRISALRYGAIVIATGTALYKAGIKPHFLESYLHVAANVIFSAVVSGIGDRSGSAVYIVVLAALSLVAIVLGVRWTRFVFVAYGIIYGYIGITVEVLNGLHGDAEVLSYFAVTGTLVIIALVILARRFGRDE